MKCSRERPSNAPALRLDQVLARASDCRLVVSCAVSGLQRSALLVTISFWHQARA